MQTSMRYAEIYPALGSDTQELTQIFEIDEDHGEGPLIDTTLIPPSHAARQRRLSQYSYGQMSDARDKSRVPSPHLPTLTVSPVPESEPAEPQPAHSESAPAPPSSGGERGSLRSHFPQTIPEVPTKGPTRPLPARPRINSLVNPSTSSASPLAMLFQPLIVDEDVIVEDQEDYQNPLKAPSHLSYGPASRRRLVSLGPRRRGQALADTSPVTSTLNRWQRPATRQQSHSLTRSDDGERFYGSQDPFQIHPSSSVPETVGQVLEDEERGGGEPGLSRRLDVMEERQKRIEEMLVRLTESLS